MNADPSPAFVDTNILIYAFADDDARRHSLASELLARLMTSGLLRLSTQVLQEFFVTATLKAKVPLSSQEALRRMDHLSEWLKYTTSYPTLREAAELSIESAISFWDALIVVSAARSGAEILYTEDLNHGQKILGVTIVNPFK